MECVRIFPQEDRNPGAVVCENRSGAFSFEDMYNGIGLSTPRGSGTNGYVQRNLGFIRAKPKIEYKAPNYTEDDKSLVRRQPNQEILEHERKRELELRVMMWAEEQHIFDSGYVQLIYS